MKLVAAMIVRNELGRYLPLVIESLLEFCDEIRVLDDRSDDGTVAWLRGQEFSPKIYVIEMREPLFDVHEGKARQVLMDWVREAEPTHVLAIDADELIDDGPMLRRKIDNDGPMIWSLSMEEVWTADESRLWIRQDGGWRAHPVPICWRCDPADDGQWLIRDSALACGREPEAISKQRARATTTGVSVLHFGWTNLSERQRRYDRYMAIDAGNFHAARHLESIMWPDRKVRLQKRRWPIDLDRGAVLARVREIRP